MSKKIISQICGIHQLIFKSIYMLSYRLVYTISYQFLILVGLPDFKAKMKDFYLAAFMHIFLVTFQSALLRAFKRNLYWSQMPYF